MFLAIVQHAPLWAWGLLAGLVALGLWQTLPRQMLSTQPAFARGVALVHGAA